MATVPKSKRERNPEETRRRILDAAEAEFARKGYDGTRLRDVALAVGVHHALLHHYFRDKEGLFRAVIERAVEGVSTRAHELLRSHSDIRALTSGFVETLVDFLAENHHLVLILHFASLDEGSPAFSICEEIGTRLVQPLLEAVIESIRFGQQQGTIRDDLEARHLVMATVGTAAFVYHADHLVSGMFRMRVRSPEAIAAHKRTVVALTLDGMLSKGPKPALPSRTAR